VLPPELAAQITLTESALDAVTAASALVVCTPWPGYRQVSAVDVSSRMTKRLVLDANRFLGGTIGADPSFIYASVGRARA
jgi:hypothetical protein